MSLSNDFLETDKEGNLCLNRSPETMAELKGLLDEILLERSDLKIMEPAYYENLLLQWRDKLLKYPLAVVADHPFVSFYGLNFSVPLAFLEELKEQYREIQRACLTRQIDNDLSLISYFVSKGETLVAYRSGESGHDEVSRRMKHDSRTVARKKDPGGVCEYSARSCGYLVYGDRGLEIIPPLINENGPYAITMRVIPVIKGTAELVQYGNEFVAAHKKKYPAAPVSEKMITEEELKGKGLFCYGEVDLVKGVEPREGRDSRIIFPSEEEGEDGGVLSVDYHKISRIRTVDEGEVIAVRELVVPGNDGLDVFGKSFPVKKGKDLPLRIDGNIQVDRRQGEFRYVAMLAGVVDFTDSCLSLKETLVIKGDVDYHTGNIDYEKSVYIKGNVISGFSVRCGGSLLVEGLVEDNGEIFCAGAIKIGKGIIGDKTRVEGEGDILCGFIERAHVKCQGNVVVERSVLGGTLDIMGDLQVRGKGLSQKSVGVMSGVLCRCFRNIHTLSLGAEANKTRLQLGYNYLIDDKISEVEEVINGHRVRISQLMDNLPFDLSTPFAVEKLKNSGKETRKQVKLILTKIKYASGEIEKLEKSRKDLSENRYEERTDCFSLHCLEGVKGRSEIVYKDSLKFIDPAAGALNIGFSSFDKEFVIT